MINRRKCSEFIDNLSNLSTRLNTNTCYGSANLTDWLVKNLELRQGMRVLDIGCGDGTQLKRVASVVGEDNLCIGVDYDAKMIRKAKELTFDFKPHINFVQMDMDKIRDSNSLIKDSSLDLAYSVYAFYYSKDEFKLLNGLKQKLGKEGKTAIIGPFGDNNKDWFIFLDQYMKMPEPVIASTTTFMEGIYRYAEKNFDKVKSKEFVNKITLPSIGALREYWMANIYYDPKYDLGFEKYAKEHFKKNKTFEFFKKAQMIIMENKK